MVKKIGKSYLLLLSIASVDAFVQSHWTQVNRNLNSFHRPSNDLIIHHYSSKGDVPTIQPPLVNTRSNHVNNASEECAIDCNGDSAYQTLVDEMAESIDITRESATLESFNSYIVVSCLTATSSLSVCLNVFGHTNDTFGNNAFQYLAVVAATTATIAGTYATVVFSLCNTYGNAAIGSNKDDMYDKFMKGSQSYRSRGFVCYLISLSTFMLEILLISANQIDGYLRYPYIVFFSAISLMVFRDWADIVSIATPIFAKDTDEITA